MGGVEQELGGDAGVLVEGHDYVGAVGTSDMEPMVVGARDREGEGVVVGGAFSYEDLAVGAADEGTKRYVLLRECALGLARRAGRLNAKAQELGPFSHQVERIRGECRQ